MFAELTRETRTLVQHEFELAKTELTQKASTMGRSVGFIVAGGLIAYGGFLAIVAAIVLALMAIGLAAWAGAMLGGILVAAIGYLLIRAGLSGVRSHDLTPRETIQTLKEDVRWLRTQTK
jgi:hypothetical protein